VCKLSYGPGLEAFTSLLLFVFLIFVIIAYMVLVRDIWTPVVILALKGSVENDNIGNIVLLAIVISMTPFMLKKDLHSLRFNCYVGFVSITVLCVAITHRAWEKYSDLPTEGPKDPIALFPKSAVDVMFAFPIITLSFLSQFNIVSIHGSLVDPTRKRIRGVIDTAVGMCFVLTYIFGLMGYLYAGEGTHGNILLNFDFGDRLVLAGRLGCGVTIMLAMPIVALPCRESALVLGPQFAAWRDGSEVAQKAENIGEEGTKGSDASSDSDSEGPTEIEMTPSRDAGGSQVMQEDVEAANHKTEKTPLLKSTESQPAYPEVPTKGETSESHCDATDKKASENGLVHIISTLLIVSTCYTGAVAAPGVAIVWSICGSSMAFLIAFILPSMCYIKVRAKHKGHWNMRVFASWMMLGFAILGAVACTLQTVWRIFFLDNSN